ncbi:MAG: SDR family NAD(P)-dependent oxidoreductase, partial [Dolichospermum sp.]
MLQDKVIVIVGATGGIGATLTRQLAPTGLRLVLAARNTENLAALANELPGSPGNVLIVPTDITQPQPCGC